MSLGIWAQDLRLQVWVRFFELRVAMSGSEVSLRFQFSVAAARRKWTWHLGFGVSGFGALRAQKLGGFRKALNPANP